MRGARPQSAAKSASETKPARSSGSSPKATASAEYRPQNQSKIAAIGTQAEAFDGKPSAASAAPGKKENANAPTRFRTPRQKKRAIASFGASAMPLHTALAASGAATMTSSGEPWWRPSVK